MSPNGKNKLKPVFIAVMGPTGSGKTSFINMASGSELRVGAGLESVTGDVQLSRPFALEKYSVTLIDTPGFDDTSRSDADILSTIADYLSTMFKAKNQLSGVIYLHRITDNRMGGTALRNFRMFMALCGTKALSNAAIVLNMWNEVSEDVRKAREAELVNKDIFFKPAVNAGAKVLHHENTTPSAQAILRHLARKAPRPLQIQRELVTERKQIRDTAAGLALLGDLAALERKHLQQLQEMQRELEEAIRKKDEEDRLEIEEARRRVEEARRDISRQQENIRADRPGASQPSKAPRSSLLSLLCSLFVCGRKTAME